MPLITIQCSAEPPAREAQQALLLRLSKTLAQKLGKPESYVMTSFLPRATMTFGGTNAPAAYAELKNVGELAPGLTLELSRTLTPILSEGLGVPANRIYIEFQSVKGHLWGFDGGTFG